jgi:hypothetical protein
MHQSLIDMTVMALETMFKAGLPVDAFRDRFEEYLEFIPEEFKDQAFLDAVKETLIRFQSPSDFSELWCELSDDSVSIEPQHTLTLVFTLMPKGTVIRKGDYLRLRDGTIEHANGLLGDVDDGIEVYRIVK